MVGRRSQPAATTPLLSAAFDTLKTALISGDDRPLCQAIESWEATAEVMSSPEMLAALTRPVDEREYVSLPEFTE